MKTTINVAGNVEFLGQDLSPEDIKDVKQHLEKALSTAIADICQRRQVLPINYTGNVFGVVGLVNAEGCGCDHLVSATTVQETPLPKGTEDLRAILQSEGLESLMPVAAPKPQPTQAAEDPHSFVSSGDRNDDLMRAIRRVRDVQKQLTDYHNEMTALAEKLIREVTKNMSDS